MKLNMVNLEFHQPSLTACGEAYPANLESHFLRHRKPYLGKGVG